MRIGKCGNCEFVGLLRPRNYPLANSLMSGSSQGMEDCEERLVCLTCFDTPAGVKSENQTHQRLPEGEYK